MKRLLSLPLLLIFLLSACGENGEQRDVPLTDYPNSHLLLSAGELHELLQSDEDFLLIDAREEHADSLIPGAVHFAAISELTDPDHPIESFLIGPDTFQEKMRAIGLSNDDRVIIYDGGNALSAARLFYALDYYGFGNSAIVNGGLQAWIAYGYDIADTPAERSEGTFSFDVNETKSCDITYVMEAANDPNKVIFDARSEDEYLGNDVRADRGGHIPNAVNLEWSEVLEPQGIPFFRSAQEIRDLYSSLGITPDKEVIPHCQTNVRGSHAYFALSLMGFDSVRPYEGSWFEYGNDPNAIIQ
ncbi:MAG: sulfurtransferase [Balneolaceae bacterium]|nr:sulfurtransferase [Balneolaceae bacterium]MCH8547660.1 sulfurtransferase [Balneolaceae bacterium]